MRYLFQERNAVRKPRKGARLNPLKSPCNRYDQCILTYKCVFAKGCACPHPAHLNRSLRFDAPSARIPHPLLCPVRFFVSEPYAMVLAGFNLIGSHPRDRQVVGKGDRILSKSFAAIPGRYEAAVMATWMLPQVFDCSLFSVDAGSKAMSGPPVGWIPKSRGSIARKRKLRAIRCRQSTTSPQRPERWIRKSCERSSLSSVTPVRLNHRWRPVQQVAGTDFLVRTLA